MHQTFYIDVDEEISSVIDRLNKSMSSDNYFVVPKRALFLQSIVNLKILKREADKISKRVILVTQDEVAISMAERSGIETCESLDGLNAAGDFYIDQNQNEEDEFENDAQENLEPKQKINIAQDKQIRLRNVGSGDFYQSSNERMPSARAIRNDAQSKPLVRRISNKKEKPAKIVIEKTPKVGASRAVSAKVVGRQEPIRPTANSKMNVVYKTQLDPHKAQTLEKMFSLDSRPQQFHQETESKNIGSGKFKKVFVFFILLCSLVFLGVGAYLYIPSAKVIIKSDVEKKKVDVEIIAKESASEGISAIPVRVIEKDEQLSLSYDVTGSKEVAGKKAHGVVVIYNEYSTEPQTLVATTRLEAKDGKIFRLVKNIVVPGSSTVAGELKPGVIEAEITADRAGSDYNIEATKFTIPGFAGGPKFNKFYANSDSATIGGTGNGSEADSGAISQTDFDSAKQKTESAFKEKMSEFIKGELSPGQIILTQAERMNMDKSSASAKLGTVTDSFDWAVSGSIKALVFSEDDVRRLVVDSLNEDEKSEFVKINISKIEYGSVEPDFDASSLKLKVYADVISTPIIDIDQVKKELLGKDDDQLADILRKYSSIKSANVEFSPSFISRIPQYTSRVWVEIENEAK